MHDRRALRTRIRWIGFGVLAVAVAWLGLRYGPELLPRFVQWIDGLGPAAGLAFAVGYACAVVVFAPGAPLTLTAGALFGLLGGVVYAFLGAAVGATAAFLVARYVARAPVERRLANDPRLLAIDRAVGHEGLKLVFLLRLSPVFPFNVLNYALGLTRVRLRDYVVASLGMLPGTIAYVYAGKLAGDVARLAAGAEVERGAAGNVLLAVGLLATIAATVLVTRTARRALRDSMST
ncbi:MAG: TVP38/TMEM64 family protein [Gemmatimonadota bacterium]